MSTRRTIYIHIGQPKTGTSALQLFFADNHKVLIRNGIFCPQKGRIGDFSGANHFRLYFGFLGPRHPICPEDIRSAREEWESVIEEIEKVPQKRILLSCEAYSLFTREQLEEINSFLADYRVKIVYYVRRIDNLLSSWSQHAVKVEGAGQLNLNALLRVKETLGIYEEVFGRENIIIRPYEKKQLYQENIFFDFLHHVLGLESFDRFKFPQKGANPNPHLSRDALEYKMRVNRLEIDAADKKQIINALFEFSAAKDAESQQAFHDNNHLSPAERLELIRENQENDKRIAVEYLGREDGRLFYEPLPDPGGAWTPYPGLTPDTTLAISKTVLCAKFPNADEGRIGQNFALAVSEQIPGLAVSASCMHEGGHEFIDGAVKRLGKMMNGKGARDEELNRIMIASTMALVCRGVLESREEAVQAGCPQESVSQGVSWQRS